MFCKKCGKNIDDSSKFCEYCGNKIEGGAVKSTPMDKGLFHSPQWQQMKVFAFSSLPQFDLVVDKEFLYVVKLPDTNGSAWIVLGLLPALIGSMMDTNKIKKYRATYIDSNNNFISTAYEKDAFLRIPLKQLNKFLVLNKKKIIISYDNKKVVLKKTNKKDFKRFEDYIKVYL